MKLERISIPPVQDLDSLKRSVETAVNRVINQINASGIITDLNMNSNRITHLAKGVSDNDAATVGQVKQAEKRATKRSSDEIGAIEVTSSSSSVIDQTLTAASTEIPSPGVPSDGDHLIVRLTQDGTGGRKITWHADYNSTTTKLITAVANKRSIFFFVGISSSWNMVAYIPEMD